MSGLENNKIKDDVDYSYDFIILFLLSFFTSIFQNLFITFSVESFEIRFNLSIHICPVNRIFRSLTCIKREKGLSCLFKTVYSGGLLNSSESLLSIDLTIILTNSCDFLFRRFKDYSSLRIYHNYNLCYLFFT